MSDLRRNAVRNLAHKKNLERKASGFAAIVVIPFVCAILGAFTPDLIAVIGKAYMTIIWVGALLLLGLFAFRLDPTGESVLGLANENEDQEEEIAKLQDANGRQNDIIDKLYSESRYSLTIKSAIIINSRKDFSSVEELTKSIGDIAAPIDDEGEYYFGLSPAEKWSFTVYLYSKSQDILIPLWRRMSQNRDQGRADLGRRWNRGEGHVGKVFVDQTDIITGDAQSPEAEPFSTVPPDKRRLYDRDLYRSFAAVPIGPLLEEDKRPYGVLVGTSNIVGRFRRENAGIMRQVAGAIASLLIAGGLDIDELIAVPHDDGAATGEEAHGELGEANDQA